MRKLIHFIKKLICFIGISRCSFVLCSWHWYVHTIFPSAPTRYIKTLQHTFLRGGGGLICLLLFGCAPATWGVLHEQNSQAASLLSPQIVSLGEKICNEASVQLDRLNGSSEVHIQSCKTVISDGNNIQWRIYLNDFSEWSQLIATRSTEEILFTVPLALVAYSFLASGVNELLFDEVVISFANPQVTEYEFTTKDLSSVLSATEPDDLTSRLRALQFKMRISTQASPIIR